MNIEYIVVHCSDSPNGREDTAEDIHRWHEEKGWSGVGYHSVIERSGVIKMGRPEYWKGAHVSGFNSIALGVCLIGTDEFTENQMISLHDQIRAWKYRYPNAKVVGHRDLDDRKTCPGFDVQSWWKGVIL